MIRHSRNANTREAQRGFSLIEVLIALIIMSVGMLGIAGLFVQGMQAGRTSLFRHNAVTLAGDVADRIRANPRAGVDYMGPGGDNGCVGTGIDCTPTQMAPRHIALGPAGGGLAAERRREYSIRRRRVAADLRDHDRLDRARSGPAA